MKLFAVALLLISALAIMPWICGCSNDIPDFSVDSNTEGTIDRPTSGNEIVSAFTGSFVVSGFDGKTKEDLINQYSSVIYYNDSLMEGVLNTPTSLLIKSMDSPILISYDKETGISTNACRDPLCDHESCLWGASGTRIYAGRDGLFFLLKQDNETMLYKTDYTGADQSLLYSSSNELSHVVQEGSFVYFLEETMDEETDTAVCRVVRMTARGSERRILLERGNLYYFMPMNGNILYLDPMDGFLLYDPEENQSDKYGSFEMRPIALFGKDFYYELGGSLYKASNYGLGNKLKLESAKSFYELIFDHEAVFCHDESTIYRIKDDFSGLDPLYKATTNERIENVILDGNLLCYQFTTGSGAARKHFYVFVDLETNAYLEVVND